MTFAISREECNHDATRGASAHVRLEHAPVDQRWTAGSMMPA